MNENILLKDKFSGPLRVSIVVNAEVYTEERDFRECINGNLTTLFDYVGSVAASIFTNMTTRLSIETKPSEWEIREFSPEARSLVVVKVGGEQWKIEEEDPRRLAAFYL